MHPRAAELVATLELLPHPEGGYYRQIYKSATSVDPLDGRPVRSALTTIYFLLPAGQVSCWHTVASDEVWHHYEGAPLELLVADASFATLQTHRLGAVGPDAAPVHVVAAHEWQAARSTGDYTLVGCTVGPGFDFADFLMLRDRPADAAAIRARWPHLSQFV